MSTIDCLDAAPALGDKTGVMLVPKWDEGHAEFKWDKKNAQDVEDARQYFIKKKAEGYVAYRIDPKTGDKGEVLKEFDPSAERIILLPPLKGG